MARKPGKEPEENLADAHQGLIKVRLGMIIIILMNQFNIRF